MWNKNEKSKWVEIMVVLLVEILNLGDGGSAAQAEASATGMRTE